MELAMATAGVPQDAEKETVGVVLIRQQVGSVPQLAGA